MAKYTADISFIDKANIIRRKKNLTVEAHSILEAAIMKKKTYKLIKIRSIKIIEAEELQECILNEYPY